MIPSQHTPDDEDVIGYTPTSSAAWGESKTSNDCITQFLSCRGCCGWRDGQGTKVPSPTVPASFFSTVTAWGESKTSNDCITQFLSCRGCWDGGTGRGQKSPALRCQFLSFRPL